MTRVALKACFLAFAILLMSGQIYAQGILNSKHNLTRQGPGDIKARAQIQEELCVFCHTPHRSRGNREVPQFGWNREESAAAYTTYESSTMYATVGQPTGASKLCLSCHDGTIALGALLSQPNVIPFQGDWEGSTANLGTHLADDHPVSFEYTDELAALNGQLVSPSSLPETMKLDAANQLQCTTCHDPHDDSNGMFLVMPNAREVLCTSCHRPTGWFSSAHAESNAVWSGVGENPWGEENTTSSRSVMGNACQNCHAPHNAGGEKGLLMFRSEEDNCVNCHDGTLAQTDILSEINKLSAHRVQDYQGIHFATELQSTVETATHVECVDCHNPHQVQQSTNTASLAPGVMRGVSGVDISGQIIPEVTFSYEVCFKCHADNNVSTSARILRQLPQLNTRLEFLQENPSSHALTAPRFNDNLPSLLPDFNSDSMITCTDCHGSDQNEADGGRGPNGPHGSTFEYMLVRNYETQDNIPETSDAYALCYGCHDRDSILGDESFAEHDSHVRGQNTPCSVCHDPHGISETQGDSRNHQYLINFDINVVSPNSLGDLYWEEGIQGPGSSRCSLACHGVDHNNTEDRPIGFDESNGLSGSPNSWPFSGAFPD